MQTDVVLPPQNNPNRDVTTQLQIGQGNITSESFNEKE